MRKEEKIFQPWQLFKASIKALGLEQVAKCMGKCSSTVYEYGKDPDTTGDKRCRNPLERIHTLLSELDAFGRVDVCRSTIAYLRTAFEEAEPSPVVEIKSTMSEEVLADSQSIAALQAAIERGESIDVVSDLTKEAKEEIARTLAKYIKEQGA